MLEKSVSGGEGLRAPVQVGARGPRSEIYDLALPASKDPYKALMCKQYSVDFGAD